MLASSEAEEITDKPVVAFQDFSAEDDNDYYDDYHPDQATLAPLGPVVAPDNLTVTGEAETNPPDIVTDLALSSEIEMDNADGTDSYEEDYPDYHPDAGTDEYQSSEDSASQEEPTIVDQIIEETQKTEGERLLEKLDKSKILEKILSKSDGSEKDRILEKILSKSDQTERDRLFDNIISKTKGEFFFSRILRNRGKIVS